MDMRKLEKRNVLFFNQPVFANESIILIKFCIMITVPLQLWGLTTCCLLIARRRGSARFNLGLTNSLGAVHLFCAEVVIVKLESSPNTKSVVCTITHLFPHFNTRCRKRKGNALYCVVTCCRVVLPCIVLIMLEIIPESLSE